MDNILEFYTKEVTPGQTSVPWLAAVQEKALHEFQYRAFPNRKDEEWKYTALDSFLAGRFSQQANKGVETKTCSNPVIGLSKAPISHEIVLYNGQILGLEALQSILPKGVIVEPILSALEKHEDKVKPWLGKLLTHEHGFHALNMAALQTGLFIYVPKQVQLETPILLSHWQDVPHAALYARHLVILEEGSSATVIERFEGENDYFTNTVTEVHVGAHANLVHYKIQAESKMAFHVGHLAVQQDFSSHFQSHSLSLGAQLARLDLTLTFLAPEATCLLNGLYLPEDGQHIDHHTTIHHLMPDCKSTQDYKGILTGKSRAVFNGKVLVSKGAVHTAAEQENKNLLLSPAAEVNTKPQLEIFADDVTCSHGATVGQLDEDALFYMATRGISTADATMALIQGFAMKNVALLPLKAMQKWMSELLEQQLRGK